MRVIRVDFPDFSSQERALERFFEAYPRVAGNTALNFYLDSWSRRGYIHNRFARWERRSDSDSSRRLLVKTGRLRRSLRMTVIDQIVSISTDVPYAKVHNEGGQIKGKFPVRAHTRRKPRGGRGPVRAHTRRVDTKIPKRQFMDIPGRPMSPFLERRLVLLTERQLEKIFR